MSAKWTIKNIKANNEGGVTNVHYLVWDEEVTGEGLDVIRHTGIRDGIIEFTPNPESESYSDFDSLTETEVVSWVKDRLGNAAVSEMEDSVAAQIVKEKNKDTPVSFPWNNTQ